MADSAADFSSLTTKKLKLDDLNAEKLQELKEELEFQKREITRLVRAVRKKTRLLENNNNNPPEAQAAGIRKRKASEISQEEEKSEPENARAIKRPNNSSGLGSGQKRAETQELNVQPNKARKTQEISGSGSRLPRRPFYSSAYSPPRDRDYSLQDKKRVRQNLDRALDLANVITKKWLLRDLELEHPEDIPITILFDFLSNARLQKVEKFIKYVERNMPESDLKSSDEDIEIRIISQLDEFDEEEEKEKGDEQQTEGKTPGEQVLSNSLISHVTSSSTSSTSGSESKSSSDSGRSLSTP